MYEMLGNQYFMSRQYTRAAEAFNKVLPASPNNKAVQRKLIICYCKTGQVDQALQLFLSLVKRDIDYIMNADPVLDDCPCPDIIYEMENHMSDTRQSLDFNLTIGMLWLYCDIEQSLKYFQIAQYEDANHPTIKSIILLLRNKIEKEKHLKY